MTKTKITSELAILETQLRSARALGALSRSYVHRAKREDSLGFIIGRDSILADWTTQDRSTVSIVADLGEMIAFEVGNGAQIWYGHRWVSYEGGKIIGETLIENRGIAKVAHPILPPLGELRAGLGQYAAGDIASVPAGFPEAARPLVTLLHQAWNGRAFDLYETPWLLTLVRALPDATFYFERAALDGETVALLWRVHGHHANGQRVRLIGSSVMTLQDGKITSDMTIVDFDAFNAQLERELIDYA
jgi:SnoaL-like domain